MTGWDNCKYPRIFELLKEQQKTAADMARGIGVSKGNITTWKSGSSAPSNTALLAIANYLDTTTDYLTGKTDEKRKTAGKPDGISNDEINALDNALDGLTAEELQQVRKYAEFLKQQRN